MRVFLHSGGPLGPAGRAALPEFLGGRTRIAFVTAASLHDEGVYFERIRAALAPPPPEGAGLDVLHLKWDDWPLETLRRADALFMGGGNTYALLKRLAASGLLQAIRERVEGGMPYMGASAGSNVAGPNILTTNDWNVVALDRFEALGLVPFNINPHYRETDPVMAPFSDSLSTANARACRTRGSVASSRGTANSGRCWISRDRPEIDSHNTWPPCDPQFCSRVRPPVPKRTPSSE